MSDAKNKPILPEDPKEAEPGRGAPGNRHYGVQTAQATNVNAPDAVIPLKDDESENRQDLKAARESEEGAGLHTTDGFVIDEAGKIDNFAVEPEMYVEDKRK